MLVGGGMFSQLIFSASRIRYVCVYIYTHMHISSLRALYQILEFQLEWLVSSLPSVRANGLQVLIFFLFLLIRRLLYIQTLAYHGKRKGGKTVHIPATHHGGKFILGISVFSNYLFRVEKEVIPFLQKSTTRTHERTLFVSQPSSNISFSGRKGCVRKRSLTWKAQEW